MKLLEHGNGLWGGLHPQTWVVIGLSFIVVALAPLSICARIILWLTGCVLLLGAGQGRRLLLLLLALAPVAGMSFLIQAVSFNGMRVLAQWQPFAGLNFAVTLEGLHFGVLLALQVLCFGTGCALISLTTTAAGLRTALGKWRLPPRLIYLIVASLNALSQLQRYVAIARESERARGLERRTLGGNVRLAVKTATTVFTLVLLEHEDRGKSLAQRRVEMPGHRIFLRTYADSRGQKVARWILPALAIGLVLLAYGGVL